MYEMVVIWWGIFDLYPPTFYIINATEITPIYIIILYMDVFVCYAVTIYSITEQVIIYFPTEFN